MKKHIDAIERNETWELVDLLISCDAIGVKWICRLKYNSDESVKKHKARLVAKRYAHNYGFDYFETFYLVARFEAIQMLLSIACQMEWKVYQFDVKSAFLNGNLDEDVYVDQPKGFVIQGVKIEKGTIRVEVSTKSMVWEITFISL